MVIWKLTADWYIQTTIESSIVVYHFLIGDIWCDITSSSHYSIKCVNVLRYNFELFTYILGNYLNCNTQSMWWTGEWHVRLSNANKWINNTHKIDYVVQTLLRIPRGHIMLYVYVYWFFSQIRYLQVTKAIDMTAQKQIEKVSFYYKLFDI